MRSAIVKSAGPHLTPEQAAAKENLKAAQLELNQASPKATQRLSTVYARQLIEVPLKLLPPNYRRRSLAKTT